MLLTNDGCDPHNDDTEDEDQDKHGHAHPNRHRKEDDLVAMMTFRAFKVMMTVMTVNTSGS